MEGIDFGTFLSDYLAGETPAKPDDISEKSWQEANDWVVNLAHLIDEGVINAERDENGQVRLYPGA